MLSDTTTHEESYLDDPETEVEEFSEELDSDDTDQPESDNEVDRSLNKLATKTNQSLSDLAELTGVLLKSNPSMIGKIREENPKLAERLAKHKKYASLFSQSEQSPPKQEGESKENVIKEAIADLVVDGKRLGFADREILRKNETFMKTLNGFMGAGYSPEKAANKAFKEAYPTKASMVETSFLSAPSEDTTEKKKSPEEVAEDKYMKSENYPKFLRERMKK